ncbi:ABC transporter substrate-binding protein [Paracraurococcus ruber]|uniref:ABC transporter substrate-binding protein n=1 Tax=Paracraurococcus ruber TaxID=77675 RepID=UPI0034DF039E
MHRRDLLLGGAAMLGAGIAAPALGQPAAARTLRFVPHANLASIDPVWTTAWIVRNHAYLVYDQLYGMDEQFNIRPQMVEGHAVEDNGLRWTFTLREGLRFHDGEPVRARDCTASIARWARRDALGQKLTSLTAEMKPLDDRRFEIRLTKPFPLLLHAFGKVTTPCLFIMPERVAQTDAFQQITDATGSGPYRFLRDQFVPGSRAAYERFAGYQPRPDGAPSMTAGAKQVHFDRVEWHILPDPATASAALTAGEVDWWETPTADLLPLLRRNRNVAVDILDFMGLFSTLRPNHLVPPFNNPGVRRAVLAAITPGDIMKAVMGTDPDLVRLQPVGVFSPSSPLASDAGMGAFAQSIERGRELLRQSGYNGERLSLLAATDIPTLSNAAMVVGDVLRRIGINLDYVATDWGTVVQRRNSREAPERGGWSGFVTNFSGFDFWDPAAHNPLRGNGEQGWVGWASSAEIEQLRDAWFEAPDLAAQQGLARRIQEAALTRDVPYIPLGQFFQPAAWRRSVTGLMKGPPVPWGARRAA